MSDTTGTARPDIAALRDRVEQGGAAKYHQAAAASGKLFARDRIALVADEGSFTEDGRFANALADGLPADGVITGTATLDGRPVAIMANDSTVKAGSWGARTVEKIIRIIEKALDLGIPMIYLVDSAGARITDQVEMFPGRRGAGRIFHTQVRASGVIPQACALFGPSAAGGAYIPAFCDFVAMNEGNASMYLGSPRMVEMVVSEKTTLEELGGARMHCSVSGSGHYLAASEEDALAAVRRYLSYLPSSWRSPVPDQELPGADGGADPGGDLGRLVPGSDRQVFDMRTFIRALADPGSFFEVHALWAREVTVGFARLAGSVIGIVANNPLYKGGVLFVDSADKAARFVEICVVVRKAYGAGLYAMAGPGFEPDATLALPSAKIAVMGADAAVNAVYAAKLARLPEDERAAETARLRAEYEQDIDIVRLASELVIDDIVQPADLRGELTRRFAAARRKHRPAVRRRHPISPV